MVLETVSQQYLFLEGELVAGFAGDCEVSFINFGQLVVDTPHGEALIEEA